MEPLVTSSDRSVWFEELERPYRFEAPFGGEEFALLLVINDPGVSPEDQRSLSGAFVAQGCRYAVCTGVHCSTWDDSIDYADVLSDPKGGRLVMTTWHEAEPLEDVVEFFATCTSFEAFVARRFLVLFIGPNPDARSRVLQSIRTHFGPERAV